MMIQNIKKTSLYGLHQRLLQMLGKKFNCAPSPQMICSAVTFGISERPKVAGAYGKKLNLMAFGIYLQQLLAKQSMLNFTYP